MTRPAPLSEILSRLDNDSSGRSQCLVPVDDDWKERMRALARNAQADDQAPNPAGMEKPSADAA